MKCYLTSTADGEHQELVFAEKRSDAIRKSEAIQWDEYINVRAVRQPDYDKYAEQRYVPKEVLIQDGWWFECYGVNERGFNCFKHLTADDKPLIKYEHVYCGQGCLDRHTAKEGIILVEDGSETRINLPGEET